jgi:hypothetical protein
MFWKITVSKVRLGSEKAGVLNITKHLIRSFGTETVGWPYKHGARWVL